MKRLLLIEADTEFYAMFCYELEEMPYDGEAHYTPLRRLEGEPLASSENAEFFGKVRAMLVTRGDVRDAKRD